MRHKLRTTAESISDAKAAIRPWLNFLLSIALHLAAFGCVFSSPFAGMHATQSTKTSRAIISVEMIANQGAENSAVKLIESQKISSAPIKSFSSEAAIKNMSPDQPQSPAIKKKTVRPEKLISASASTARTSDLPTNVSTTAPPPAPNYQQSSVLDPPPIPLTDIEPEYPEKVGMQEGSVVLRLLINEQGIVDNVAVVRAFPSGLFESAALEAFSKAKFSPGKWLGIAVKSQITVEVKFTPINRGATVSGQSY